MQEKKKSLEPLNDKPRHKIVLLDTRYESFLVTVLDISDNFRHFINVCSLQQLQGEIICKYSPKIIKLNSVSSKIKVERWRWTKSVYLYSYTFLDTSAVKILIKYQYTTWHNLYQKYIIGLNQKYLKSTYLKSNTKNKFDWKLHNIQKGDRKLLSYP